MQTTAKIKQAAKRMDKTFIDNNYEGRITSHFGKKKKKKTLQDAKKTKTTDVLRVNIV